MLIGMLARGTLAGYVATAAMDASQTSIIPAVGDWIVNRLGKSGGDTAQPQEDNGGGDEPSLSSPALVARRAASLAGAELDREQAELWGNRVHWAYGVQWGIVLLLLRRGPGPGFGLLYGAALWLLSDELLLWVLGIAKSPASYPPRTHLDALAAHCVYGLVAGTVARGLHNGR
jgi:hypothetical protein